MKKKKKRRNVICDWSKIKRSATVWDTVASDSTYTALKRTNSACAALDFNKEQKALYHGRTGLSDTIHNQA